jgi:hypothetical protein
MAQNGRIHAVRGRAEKHHGPAIITDLGEAAALRFIDHPCVEPHPGRGGVGYLRMSGPGAALAGA